MLARSFHAGVTYAQPRNYFHGLIALSLSLGCLVVPPLASPAVAQSPAQETCGPIIECVDTLLGKIEKLESRIAALETLLNGAVVDYDRSSCPQMTTPFTLGFGKVIVGAGKGELRAVPNKVVFLSERSFKSQGGMEQFNLGIENIPPHDHGMKGVFDGSPLNEDKKGTKYMPGGHLKKTVYGEASDMWKDGGGKAFDIMPPFVSLTRCILRTE